MLHRRAQTVSNYALGSEAYLAAIADYYGSIESKLEEVAISRGFITRNGTVNINKLSDASGVSTSTLWYLLKGKDKFRAFNLVTLSKLCQTLHVQPGDLLTHVPSGSANGLGYSQEVFGKLRGTQHSQVSVDQAREYAGEERDEERVSLSDAA
jgi:DNA-binding Xre family transcriptional regulator